MIEFSDLKGIVSGRVVQESGKREIRYLITDSRKPIMPLSLFIAINGERHNAHKQLLDVYRRGVRCFIIEEETDLSEMENASVFWVESSVEALQALGRHKRTKSLAGVIGVTGSNGKTIIKEWLFQILSAGKDVVKSPASYNSQIGVPLSLWNIRKDTEYAIIEAGISKMGEMEVLEDLIKPNIGIFSNLGPAHDEGFETRDIKLGEKASLFKHAEWVIYCRDHENIHNKLKERNSFTWGRNSDSRLRILKVSQKSGKTEILLEEKNQFSVTLPFTDRASVENAMHVTACLVHLGVAENIIVEGLQKLQNIKMRLEVKEGLHNSIVIDDTYNNDLAGFKMAVEYLVQQAREKKMCVIFSDILQTGTDKKILYSEIAEILTENVVSTAYSIGGDSKVFKKYFEGESRHFTSTSEFIEKVSVSEFRDCAILIKGARNFHFEEIVTLFEKQATGTVLEININAIVHNFNYFKSLTKPDVKFMAMIKALAYGSGSTEIASVLEYHGVDYFGVAYADEGVVLRSGGIKTPIMVMNPDKYSFSKYLEYDLEPEIYSMNLLKDYADFLDGTEGKVHLKIETGMNRLGFDAGELDALFTYLKSNTNIHIVSIFSHLVGSESKTHDSFTHQQAASLYRLSYTFKRELGIEPMLHILNSAGISRFPQYNFDMVRLGLGLHGLSEDPSLKGQLMPVQKLKTIISQIKDIPAGESVGYDRAGKYSLPKRIATIAIGYADGFRRSLGNGRGCVYIKGVKAPVVGNVCMDMSMVDITGIDKVYEGDEVIIFDEDHTVIEMAKTAGTIPYEILTGISQRVKRVYVYE